MTILTKAIKQKLEENYRANLDETGSPLESPIDHKPPLKLFNLSGSATWLITEIDEEGERFFGLCDLGFGTPELGYVGVQELMQFRNQFGLGIERDKFFTPQKTISEYAAEARHHGSIQA